MVIYCDTSFLFSLYGNDGHTSRAVAWMASCTDPLRLNLLTQYEFANALRFAEFRKALKKGEAAQCHAGFDNALACGRVIVETSNLADVVAEAQRLSATRTLRGGHRGFDILHVASALVLGADRFLTFDANQKKLAEAEGLLVPF
jgi:predicted nucleic acid-binding protein